MKNSLGSNLRRMAPVFVGSMLVGSLVAVLIMQQSSPQANASDAEPVQAGSTDSYRFASVEVTYPFVSARSGATAALDRAGVQYTAEWIGSSYPGQANCRIVLFDEKDSVVGQVDLSVSHPDNPARSVLIPVEVSGAATRAEGSCDPSVYDPGAGYSFGAITSTIEIGGGWSELLVESEWVGEGPPGARRCVVTINFSDGTRETLDPVNVLTVDRESEVSFRFNSTSESAIESFSAECSQLK